MSAKTKTITTVILFEDEVRQAAKAVAKFRDLAKDDSASEDDHCIALQNLYRTCYVALAGAENDEAVVMLGRKP